MKPILHPQMVEAVRLTRSGNLGAATALLQRMLRTRAAPSSATEGPRAQGARLRCVPGLLDVPIEPVEAPILLRTNSDGGIGAALPGARRPRAYSPAVTTEVPPDGERFVSASFTSQAGSRAYKLYIPSSYCGKPLPLVVMLHGCTQSPDDFAAGTRMNTVGEERAMFVAYPAQPKSANGSKCWNWFNPGDQQRNCGEPSLIAGITRQIARDYAIDTRRIYVAGLSAGGAAAAIMGRAYPDLYAAVGVHSGLPCGAARDLASALAAMKQGSPGAASPSNCSSAIPRSGCLAPTIVFHGDKDTTVHPHNGTHVIEQLKAAQPAELRQVTQCGQVPGGHAYSRTRHLDAADRAVLEMWVVHGARHAWSGGSSAGSYSDPLGPDASREMARFFLEHVHPAAPSP